MRRPFPLLAPFLLLAACGGGGGAGNGAGNIVTAAPAAGPASFDRADGSFDRDRYRIAGIRSCVAGMLSQDAGIGADAANRMCTCLVERQIAANSDAVLRASIGDPAVSRRTLDEASRQCGLPVPTDADLATARGNAPAAADEPPPEEPPPSLDGVLPPPAVGEPPRR